MEPQKHDEELAAHTAAILTGVEIVNGEASRGKLRMVEHKSRTYILEYCGIKYVLLSSPATTKEISIIIVNLASLLFREPNKNNTSQIQVSFH